MLKEIMKKKHPVANHTRKKNIPILKKETPYFLSLLFLTRERKLDAFVLQLLKK